VQRGFIVTEDPEHGKRRFQVNSPVIIGRASDCDIAIDDVAASRHHVEVARGAEGFTWKDLGSTNGTLMNGMPMLRGPLRDSDELCIGETVLRFEIEETGGSSSDESDLFKTLIQADGGSVERSEETARAEELLRAVYQVINQIAATYDPCTLVDRVLETVMKAVAAQRGAVLFAGPDGEELLPCPECGKYHVVERGRLRHVDREGVRISKTVAHRVLNRGESVLSKNPLADTDLNAAVSIISLQLSSVMCVPLRGKQGIPGLLYMDTDDPCQSYTREDLLLATAVGNSAGLALENARMQGEMIEKERTDQEIQHAWTIQESFLPKDWPEDDPRFRVYGETRPAKVVGGDFFDFVRIDADHVGVLIGDVSGKGVPASLTMAQLLADFRVRARAGSSPSGVVAGLNEELCRRSTHGIFCTLVYVTLDLRTGTATASNAGHHAALCVGAMEPREVAPASGPPVGVIPGGSWTDEVFKIGAGETLLMFTDGIVEARGMHTRRDMSGTSDEFGMRNVGRVASGFASEGPRLLADNVIRSVFEYTAPALPHDDCTLIALRFGK
jgi:sigma-B regulation protein RsbU (phosphoserine phosphatase)